MILARRVSLLAATAACGALLIVAGSVRSSTVVSECTARDIDSAMAKGTVNDIRDIHSRLYSDNVAADYYVRAYAGWRLAQLLGDDHKKERKSALKAARKDLDRLLKDGPDNPEALALRGGVTGELITGAFSGMTLGPKISRDLDKALDIAPDNPRVALIRGVNFHFTPGAFGGGDEKAEQELQRARSLFEDRAAEKWPDWGKIDTLAWLGQILASQDRLGDALAILDEALAIDPDHHWIRQLQSVIKPLH